MLQMPITGAKERKIMMYEGNGRLKDEQAAEAERAWAAGDTGTSARTKDAAEARKQASEAQEAAEEQGMAPDEMELMKKSLEEAILVWQVRYLESRAIKEGLLSNWREAKRETWGDPRS
jgi:hypothetical protein